MYVRGGGGGGEGGGGSDQLNIMPTVNLLRDSGLKMRRRF